MGTIAVDIGYGNMRASLRKFGVNLYNFVCFNFLHSMVWYGNCLFDKIKSTLKHNSKYIISES